MTPRRGLNRRDFTDKSRNQSTKEDQSLRCKIKRHEINRNPRKIKFLKRKLINAARFYYIINKIIVNRPMEAETEDFKPRPFFGVIP